MDIKDHTISDQTIRYLRQIESILSDDCHERTALHFRHAIDRRLNGVNTDVERKCCHKCLSRIKRWRIRPKTKSGHKSGQLAANKLLGKCGICETVNTFDGLSKQIAAKVGHKTVPKTPHVKSNVVNNTFNGLKSGSNTPKTPTNVPKTTTTGSASKSRQKEILQNLLNSNKKRKLDQKTGLFDFLQICTQNQ